jgi:hypothetical protein
MKTMRIALVLLVSCSCTLLKRNSKTTDQSFLDSSEDRYASASLERSKESSGQQIVSIRDSIGTDYTIHFWPKGKMDFTAEGGFAGEFDSIRMTGRQKKLTNRKDISHSNTSESSKVVLDEHQKQTLKSGRERVTKLKIPDFKLILIIMVVLIAVALLVKRWKFKS